MFENANIFTHMNLMYYTIKTIDSRCGIKNLETIRNIFTYHYIVLHN